MIIDEAEAHRRAHETEERFPHHSCRLCYSCEELLAAAILQAVQDTARACIGICLVNADDPNQTMQLISSAYSLGEQKNAR